MGPTQGNDSGDQDDEKQSSAQDVNDTDFSDWCGWHKDHGSLTGLVPAMYIDAQGNQVKCPDPQSGLYIKSRVGRTVHVQLPKDSLAFQVGETAQIHTGGILQATPHAVRGCSGSDSQSISRQSFAVFMEPEYHGDMDIPKGKTIEDAQQKEAERYLPS